jgi:hypothetical protein
MVFGSKKFVRAVVASALAPVFAASPNVFAQAPEHVVSSTDMQKVAADAAQTRQQNVELLNRFFSSEKAEQALKSSNIDPQQVRSAVSSLSDEELAQMAARAKKAQRDFAAGNMNDHDLLLILVIVAVLILVIVAVR